MPVLDGGFTAIIANGATESGALDLKDYTLCGLHMPAAFTGVAITFLASDTLAGTYREVNGGTAYSVTVAAAKYVPIDTTKFEGVRFLKLKSGSAEGAARTIVLATKLRR